MANPTEEIRDGANEVIDETTIPERTPEELRENDTWKAVKEILKTPEDAKDLAGSIEGRLTSEESGLYLAIRNAIATNLGYTSDQGKYFNPKGDSIDVRGLDATEKIKEWYPDSLILKMIANRVASFGSKAPELTEDARKLLGIKKGEPVEVDEISE